MQQFGRFEKVARPTPQSAQTESFADLLGGPEYFDQYGDTGRIDVENVTEVKREEAASRRVQHSEKDSAQLRRRIDTDSARELCLAFRAALLGLDVKRVCVQ